MPGSRRPKPRQPRRRVPISEKRRIVERILGEGARISALAREYSVNRHTIYHWQALYRTGKLEAEPISAACAGASSPTFLPVTVGSARSRPSPRSLRAKAGDVSVVELTISSGAMLRIETSSLSIELIRALIAELGR